MSHDKDIEGLLKNIQEGLKKYTIKELNQAIVEFLNKKDDKTQEINYILEIVSQEFNISIRLLKQKNGRGDISEAKQVAYCLLHFNLGLSSRYIAERVFITQWHSVVHKAIVRFKSINLSLKPDREFMEKYEALNKKFIENFTSKNQPINEHQSI